MARPSWRSIQTPHPESLHGANLSFCPASFLNHWNWHLGWHCAGWLDNSPIPLTSVPGEGLWGEIGG